MRSLRRGETGAAVVEFALVVPVLFLIVFAVIDFGRALWIQNVLISGVREGARAGAVQQTTALAQSAAKIATACYIGRILKGAVACSATGDATIAGGTVVYSAASVNATCDCATGGTGLLTVSLASGYAFTPATPYASRFGLASLTFSPVAVFRWELSS
jgi:Flp pilus assembly protein TadG